MQIRVSNWLTSISHITDFCALYGEDYTSKNRPNLRGSVKWVEYERTMKGVEMCFWEVAKNDVEASDSDEDEQIPLIDEYEQKKNLPST